MSLSFRSFAKVNLHLEIAGRRADGYHELRTVFQTIDLHDLLVVERTNSPRRIELEVSGASLAADGSNLVARAATAFFSAHPSLEAGARIRLAKRIPLGGGLGGGSSNAATTLVALARLFGVSWRAADLFESARSLGADVPFFLYGGTALGLDRGDRVLALPEPRAGDLDLWLAIPPWSTATAEVFAAVREQEYAPTPSPLVCSAMAGEERESVSDWIGENALENPAFLLRTEQRALYTGLVRAGASKVRMSGTGSVMFALFDDPALARAAPASLPRGTVWQKARTLGRDAWRRASGIGTIEGES